MSETGLNAPPKLDDVMLAMDVVDTLRHREQMIDAELGGADREGKLVARLKDIYASQGITVPERILVDGVKALEEKRFVYEPKGGGLARRIALLYVARDRWGRPLALGLGLLALALGVYQFGVVAPTRAAAARTATELSVTLPNDLAAAHDAALALAANDNAKRVVDGAYDAGLADLAARNVKQTRGDVERLKYLADDLSVDLTIRVVQGPSEQSGVFRVPEDNPSARNYYLIVEGVANGAAHPLYVTSEETGETARVSKWGVRVSDAEYEKIRADKQDDGIIQNNIVGDKPKGALAPVYTIDAQGGAITEWRR